MVSNAQLTSFFTANTQMGLSIVQRIALASEGLVTLDDFSDFKEEELKTAFKNARSGISGTLRIDAVPAVFVGDVETEPEQVAIPAVSGVRAVPISAKSTSRLLVASVAYH